MADPPRPAFYAAAPGRWRDWWTLLHPPYTAWHLSYVVLGASVAPTVRVDRLLPSVGAFFLAVGIGAHALDELHGRPLGTRIPTRVLVAAAVASLAGAVTLGGFGVARVGWLLVPFIVVGCLLAAAYSLELGHGVLHNDAGFALAWGAFPVLTGYAAQTDRLAAAPVLLAVAAFALSYAQRALSTPARLLRRRTSEVGGTLLLRDGERRLIDQRSLLGPLETALAAMSWGLVALAAGLAVGRLG